MTILLRNKQYVAFLCIMRFDFIVNCDTDVSEGM